MSHNDLNNYYRTIFSLKERKDSRWGVPEIEELPAFERDIYIKILLDQLKKKEEQ